MMLLRPLYEAWLLDATQGPLAPWKRALLKRALVRDEALRCLAAELAQFFPGRFYLAVDSLDACEKHARPLPCVASFPIHYEQPGDRWKERASVWR